MIIAEVLRARGIFSYRMVIFEKVAIIAPLISFNDRTYKKFEDDIQNISAKASTTRSIVSRALVLKSITRHTRVQLERLDRNFGVGLQGDARNCAEMQY